MLYVASLADYDLMCEEDPSTNRMMESLDLFSKVVNNAFFLSVDIILFLNKVRQLEKSLCALSLNGLTFLSLEKTDVFRKKIKRTPFNVCFRDYPSSKDAHSYEEAVRFTSAKFNEVK